MTDDGDKWGCPAWRDKAAYPKHESDLIYWEWRWQFLRRTPYYRNLWDQQKEHHPRDEWRLLENVEPDKTPKLFFQHRTNLGKLINPRCPTIGSKDPFIFGTPGDLFNLGYRDQWDDVDWQMAHAEHPSEDEAYFCRRALNNLLDYLEIEGLLCDVPSPFAYIRFDSSRAIRPQIKAAEKRLRSLTLKLRAPRLDNAKDRENWPLYLRLVDASDQEAKPMEIFNQMGQERESDRIAFDKWQDINNPAAKVMQWQVAAQELMNKIAFMQ